MCQIALTNPASYKSSMGRLKSTLSTRREQVAPLHLEVTTLCHKFYLLMRPRDLYIIAFSPDDASYAYLKGDGLPALPFGGSHSNLGTGAWALSQDSISGMSVLCTPYTKKTRSEEAIKQAISHAVVAIAEASRFRSVLSKVADALKPGNSISRGDLKTLVGTRFTCWKDLSGQEGMDEDHADVRVHWRPSNV